MSFLLNVLPYDFYLMICLLHFTQGNLSFGSWVLVRHCHSLYKGLHCDSFYRQLHCESLNKELHCDSLYRKLHCESFYKGLHCDSFYRGLHCDSFYRGVHCKRITMQFLGEDESQCNSL